MQPQISTPKGDRSKDDNSKNVVKAISDLFQDMKLDVRATEIYLRVWRKRLARYELYRDFVLYTVFVLLFASLAVRVIPVAVRPMAFSGSLSLSRHPLFGPSALVLFFPHFRSSYMCTL
eukprot:tig00020592_g11680.t1